MHYIKPIILLGFIFFSTGTCIHGQLADVNPSEKLIPSKNISLPIGRVSLDQRINEGFAPIGNGIGNIVFYAPKITEDVLIREIGIGRSSEEFYDQPPFMVDYSYDRSSSPKVNSTYRIALEGEDNTDLIKVSYFETERIKWDDEVLLNGKSIVFTPDFTQIEADSSELLVKVKTEISLKELEIYIKPLYTQDNVASIDGVVVNYQAEVIGKLGEPISINGLKLTISPNPASSYSLEDQKVYSIQIVPVSFLPIIILFLILGATYFTFYFKFINIRKFRLALDVVMGKYSDPKEEGEVSHFQALATALSGTVGLGNIAGVAIAISIGGAGATFWMILVGLLGMSSKFVECTLGVKYRVINERGIVSGGPMYYLSTGLKEKGYSWLGRIGAIFFSIMCIGASYGSGNMFQVNQAFQQFQLVTGGEASFINGYAWVFGLAMAVLVASVIIGGIKSIANVTDKIVPIMCGIYFLAGLVILIMNITEIPRAFIEIITEAFTPLAVAGGFIGVLIQGFRRGAFSNEAGVGSASIAHAAVKTNHPASEGIVALLEPFIDTVVVCTTTALVIIITNNHLDPNASDGVALTSAAFSGELPFFQYVLSLAVILFAFSTMISWSYYGLKSWTYLFGDSSVSDITYKVSFCICIIIGAAASLGSVMAFSDAMIFAMALPNIIGLVILLPEVKEELNSYLAKIKSGEIIRTS